MKSRKIICPGLGRTGTTTLAECLNTFGYRTREVEGHWYLVKIEEGIMRFDPESLSTTETYQAFVDSPVALVYRDLLEAFPGSMIIVFSTRA